MRGSCTTRAPAASASSGEPSVEPLSATTTSPSMPSRSIVRSAFPTTIAIDSASFRQGMTTESSSCGGPPPGHAASSCSRPGQTVAIQRGQARAAQASAPPVDPASAKSLGALDHARVAPSSEHRPEARRSQARRPTRARAARRRRRRRRPRRAGRRRRPRGRRSPRSRSGERREEDEREHDRDQRGPEVEAERLAQHPGRGDDQQLEGDAEEHDLDQALALGGVAPQRLGDLGRPGTSAAGGSARGRGGAARTHATSAAGRARRGHDRERHDELPGLDAAGIDRHPEPGEGEQAAEGGRPVDDHRGQRRARAARPRARRSRRAARRLRTRSARGCWRTRPTSRRGATRASAGRQPGDDEQEAPARARERRRTSGAGHRRRTSPTTRRRSRRRKCSSRSTARPRRAARR